ncbi:hypothetical protein GGR56DRAFT_646175 [Xylariaceae sp. FL0804]|nr:hypothetical protein GGR56DRAFT_646175 [Xylariaceae sp. FL0804]
MGRFHAGWPILMSNINTTARSIARRTQWDAEALSHGRSTYKALLRTLGYDIGLDFALASVTDQEGDFKSILLNLDYINNSTSMMIKRSSRLGRIQGRITELVENALREASEHPEREYRGADSRGADSRARSFRNIFGLWSSKHACVPVREFAILRRKLQPMSLAIDDVRNNLQMVHEIVTDIMDTLRPIHRDLKALEQNENDDEKYAYQFAGWDNNEAYDQAGIWMVALQKQTDAFIATWDQPPLDFGLREASPTSSTTNPTLVTILTK